MDKVDEWAVRTPRGGEAYGAREENSIRVLMRYGAAGADVQEARG
ncbi:hypothetical protein [Pyrodictium abyssi]